MIRPDAAARRARKHERMMARDRAARISFDPSIIEFMVDSILYQRRGMKVDFGSAYHRQEFARAIADALKTVGAVR